jgi:hypothetical protein
MRRVSASLLQVGLRRSIVLGEVPPTGRSAEEPGGGVVSEIGCGPSRAEIRRALAATTGDMLIPAGFGLAVLYAIYTVGWLFRPAPYAHLDAVVEGVSGGLFLSAALLLRRRPVPAAWAHPLALGYGLLLLANCLLTLAQDGGPSDTFDIVMLLIGAAVFFRSLPYLLVLVGAGATGWVLVARHVQLGPAALPYMYLIVEACVIAVLVNVALLRTAVRLERARDRLRHAAEHDPLTGLYNRRGFWERGSALIQAADRAGVRFETMFVDIDRMKDINDQHGHVAGTRRSATPPACCGSPRRPGR